jgi:hypothetical protein
MAQTPKPIVPIDEAILRPVPRKRKSRVRGDLARTVVA